MNRMIMSVNKKMLVAAAFTLLIAVTIVQLYQGVYIAFRPVTFDGDSFEYGKKWTDILRRENLKFVLNYHSVKFKIDSGGDILIQRKVYSDKEVLWNYTSKALDTTWINQHRK